ncbi:MAG: carbon-nitrogen hydrolase family protein [Candidatus Eremiobacteraeota bacterium]|nr:carbon-nitrogen hydrolase family protein [Candidatus Eremiobacteraeota bacterium]
MTTTTITAACIQLRAHERADFTSIWPDVLDEVRSAASHGATLIVLPEGTVPAYVLGSERLDSDQCERALDDLREAARELGTVIVFGGARCADDRIFNSAFVVDVDGRVAGVADKHFLWHFDRQWFTRGRTIEPIDTSIGRLGVMICADGRIPTIARKLVDAGAQVLVMPTAWVTSVRDPENLENIQADLLAVVRARENAVPFIAANKCGVERGCVAYCGKSQIVDKLGSVRAIADQHHPQTLVERIEVGSVTPPRVQPDSRTSVSPVSTSMRIAITPFAAHPELDEDLRILETPYLVAPGERVRNSIDGAIPTLHASDAIVLDPGGLPAYKQAGYQLIIWQTSAQSDWTVRIARARALELRMYVIVLDMGDAPRAYAIDPDGTVVAGTSGEYRLASFLLEASRTKATMLAPGTDVLEGLQAVSLLHDRRYGGRL